MLIQDSTRQLKQDGEDPTLIIWEDKRPAEIESSSDDKEDDPSDTADSDEDRDSGKESTDQEGLESPALDQCSSFLVLSLCFWILKPTS